MALKVDTTFKGIPVLGAYCTVEGLSIAVGKNLMGFHVFYRAGSDEEVFDTRVFSAPYDLESGNPFEQAYAYLKGLEDSEFVTAKDC